MTLADTARSAEQARELAVAVLVCERYLARLEPRPNDELSAASRTVLDRWPGSERWAGAFLDRVGQVEPRDFRRHVGPSTVRRAVLTLAATSNPDAALYDLLSGAVQVCETLVERAATSIRTPEHRLTAVEP